MTSDDVAMLDFYLDRELEDKTVAHESAFEQAGYVMLPMMVLFNQDLSPGAKVVYAALKHYAWEREECWPGRETLAEQLGVSRTSITGYLSELRSFGLVRVVRRGQGKTNLYRISDFQKAKSLPSKRQGSGRKLEVEEQGRRNRDSSSLGGGQENGRRDRLFEAVANAWIPRSFTVEGHPGVPLTKAERGEVNAAVKQLREIGAEPWRVELRAAKYRRDHPDWAFTPSALVKHWNQLETTNERVIAKTRAKERA